MHIKKWMWHFTQFYCINLIKIRLKIRERSGSVVECLTRDQRAVGSSLISVTVLCPRARHINPCLVLVQRRKTHPDIAEKLLTRRYKTNQTNKQRLINPKSATYNLQQTTNSNFAGFFSKITNKAWYFTRIVCWQTILMKYHTLFLSKARKDVTKFVVCCSHDWRFKC